MTRPDLTDPEQRLAYRRELRGVYRPWRYAALAMVVAGVLGSVFDPGHEPWWTILVVFGGVTIAGVIIARTRYHQRRMR
jgi:cyanate permease